MTILAGGVSGWCRGGGWVGGGHAAQVYFETPLPTSPSLLGPEISYPLQLLRSSCGRAEQGTVTAAPWRENVQFASRRLRPLVRALQRQRSAREARL